MYDFLKNTLVANKGNASQRIIPKIRPEHLKHPVNLSVQFDGRTESVLIQLRGICIQGYPHIKSLQF